MISGSKLGTRTQFLPLHHRVPRVSKIWLNVEKHNKFGNSQSIIAYCCCYLRERLDCRRLKETKAIMTSKSKTPSTKQTMATVKSEDWVPPLCSDVTAKASRKKKGKKSSTIFWSVVNT